MKKFADRYFIKDNWKVIESGYNPAYSQVAESVFSLGNEYMGVRGFFEEGYSGETLIGSYFNGVYERQKLNVTSYKGVVDSTEFMVNAVNWLYTKIQSDDETLDLNQSRFSTYIRELDLKRGLLTRSFVWECKSGKRIKVEFERFVSMVDVHAGAQQIKLTALNFDGNAAVELGLDFSLKHEAYGKNYWNCAGQEAGGNTLSILGTTVSTDQTVLARCQVFGVPNQGEALIEDKKISKRWVCDLHKNETLTITRMSVNFTSERKDTERVFTADDYERLKQDNMVWWKEAWEKSDIRIKGDDLNQQGIRFCIFQMFQTYHGAMEGTNIGAKGLTGESYNGNAFWDTEVYCLPFYVFNNQKAAKNLLLFRYYTLDEARERAKELDCKGAFYPVATIRGKECCNLWQHASLQLQASTAVAYGIWFYEKITNDCDFVFEYGLPMLIEISRMLASRGSYTDDGDRFGYYGVMGPDEFQMMVNHNFYTNYMAKFVFEYTLEVIEEAKKMNPEMLDSAVEQCALMDEERSAWRDMAVKMHIPFDEKSKIFEQHEGYRQLPEVNIREIPADEFPLYSNWSYDRIYRNKMIKQPDVLMIMLMFNSSFSEEVVKANYEYYEPRCIHESSLSPSVHSILAAQLKKHAEAYEFFKFATRMDLDNYNRNTDEGLHTTSIAAAWMNIMYGFAGMRSDKEILAFAPYVPKEWEGYSARISYIGNVLHVDVNQSRVVFQLLHEGSIPIEVYGRPYQISAEETVVNIPREWRDINE